MMDGAKDQKRSQKKSKELSGEKKKKTSHSIGRLMQDMEKIENLSRSPLTGISLNSSISELPQSFETKTKPSILSNRQVKPATIVSSQQATCGKTQQYDGDIQQGIYNSVSFPIRSVGLSFGGLQETSLVKNTVPLKPSKPVSSQQAVYITTQQYRNMLQGTHNSARFPMNSVGLPLGGFVETPLLVSNIVPKVNNPVSSQQTANVTTADPNGNVQQENYDSERFSFRPGGLSLDNTTSQSLASVQALGKGNSSLFEVNQVQHKSDNDRLAPILNIDQMPIYVSNEVEIENSALLTPTVAAGNESNNTSHEELLDRSNSNDTVSDISEQDERDPAGLNLVEPALVNNANIAGNNNMIQQEQDLHNANCCNGCKMGITQIMNKLNRIEEKINALLSLNQNPHLVHQNFNLLPAMPIDNIADLQIFNNNLQTNPEMEEQFENKIAGIGGDTMPKLAKNIMPAILTDEFAKNLTWVANVQNKTAISDKFFISIVIRVIRKVYPISSETEVKKVLQLWIQKPSDRISNRERKLRRREELGREYGAV